MDRFGLCTEFACPFFLVILWYLLLLHVKLSACLSQQMGFLSRIRLCQLLIGQKNNLYYPVQSGKRNSIITFMCSDTHGHCCISHTSLVQLVRLCERFAWLLRISYVNEGKGKCPSHDLTRKIGHGRLNTFYSEVDRLQVLLIQLAVLESGVKEM